MRSIGIENYSDDAPYFTCMNCIASSSWKREVAEGEYAVCCCCDEVLGIAADFAAAIREAHGRELQAQEERWYMLDCAHEEAIKMQARMDWSLRDRAVHALNVGKLHEYVVENLDDPWFIKGVANRLSEGFYWHPELLVTGRHNKDSGDWEWTPSDHKDAEYRAWIMLAAAYKNGHRLHELGY